MTKNVVIYIALVQRGQPDSHLLCTCIVAANLAKQNKSFPETMKSTP